MLSCEAWGLSRLQRSKSWLAVNIAFSDNVFSVETLRFQYRRSLGCEFWRLIPLFEQSWSGACSLGSLMTSFAFFSVLQRK